MRKAIVIGCPGSGKTVFSQRLHQRTGLPLFHLDSIWHKPDRTHISREEFDEKLSRLVSLDEWIIDGNYPRTMELRLQMCDTVFLFDLPAEACIQGAVSRLGIPRCDMPWTDTELDPTLQQVIRSFPHKALPAIYELLDKHGKDKQIIIFTAREQAYEYLNM